jgi:hypothetical protein
VRAVTERNFALSESSLPGSDAAQAIERKFALNGSASLGRGGEACTGLKNEFSGSGLRRCAGADFIEPNFGLNGPAPQGRGGEACIELKSEFNGLACSDADAEDFIEPNFGLSEYRGPVEGSRGRQPRTSTLTFGEHCRLDERNFALVDHARSADGGLVDAARKQRGLKSEPTLPAANFSGDLA